MKKYLKNIVWWLGLLTSLSTIYVYRQLLWAFSKTRLGNIVVLEVLILLFLIDWVKNRHFLSQPRKRKNVIPLIRTFEDFNSWLDKTLEDCKKEDSDIQANFIAKGMLSSGPYLTAQAERVKKYQAKIMEYSVGVERKIEDYLIKTKQKNIDSISCLGKQEKAKLKYILNRKEAVLKGIAKETVNKLGGKLSSVQQKQLGL